MNHGALLDTHSLLWLKAGFPMRPEAGFAIGEAMANGSLFVSQIFLWELGLATRKAEAARRPDLGGLSIEDYLEEVRSSFGIHLLCISDAIALQASAVPAISGLGDPGDCFHIATAHVHGLVLTTRDAKIIALAKQRPDYLTVIPC